MRIGPSRAPRSTQRPRRMRAHRRRRTRSRTSRGRLAPSAGCQPCTWYTSRRCARAPGSGGLCCGRTVGGIREPIGSPPPNCFGARGAAGSPSHPRTCFGPRDAPLRVPSPRPRRHNLSWAISCCSPHCLGACRWCLSCRASRWRRLWEIFGRRPADGAASAAARGCRRARAGSSSTPRRWSCSARPPRMTLSQGCSAPSKTAVEGAQGNARSGRCGGRRDGRARRSRAAIRVTAREAFPVCSLSPSASRVAVEPDEAAAVAAGGGTRRSEAVPRVLPSSLAPPVSLERPRACRTWMIGDDGYPEVWALWGQQPRQPVRSVHLNGCARSHAISPRLSPSTTTLLKSACGGASCSLRPPLSRLNRAHVRLITWRPRPLAEPPRQPPMRLLPPLRMLWEVLGWRWTLHDWKLLLCPWASHRLHILRSSGIRVSGGCFATLPASMSS